MKLVMKPNQGFTLIELLIVVAVILTIAAIAIPLLLRAKISANEASAVAAVRSIHSAQQVYVREYPNVGYADDLAKLGPPPLGNPRSPNRANLLDLVVGCAAQPCLKSGYLLALDQISGNPVDSFRIRAVPQVFERTGVRGFCSSVPGVIIADPNGGSNCTDPI
jgi:type IV pilus assembly protein PilA